MEIFPALCGGLATKLGVEVFLDMFGQLHIDDSSI